MSKRIILLILIVLNLGTIFFFSHQDATTSTALSSAISKQIEVNIPNYEQKNQGEKNVLHNHLQRGLRKAAHASLFFTLGVLVLLFCFTFSLGRIWSALCTVSFGFLCALGDEFHQSFVPGRTAQYEDVVADMMGILLGIAIGIIGLLISNIITKATKKR